MPCTLNPEAEGHDLRASELRGTKMNRGKFRITRTCFDEGVMTSALTALFSKVFPFEIEWNYDGVGIYTALSSLFDKLEDGEEIPFYEMVFTREESGFSLQAKRIR
jgi:hypothetical protein